MSFSTIEQAIEAQRLGRFVVVVDDESRENEGDLILPAEKMTAEAMAFLVRHSSGVVCVAMPNEWADRLELPLMVPRSDDAYGTAFTVSVDLQGSTTGISASERSATVRALGSSARGADSFLRPGHVFPLRRHPDGILGRPGHTEAASELASLAGFAPVGALCEIVRDDGEMARRPELIEFAKRHELPIITVGDLIAYRQKQNELPKRISVSRLPTRHGDFTAHIFRAADGAEHLSIVMGPVEGDGTLVRMHSECLTGDLLGSLRCDCGSQLNLALERIAQEGRGVLIYLRGHEGRGIGLTQKLRAYELQDQGADTVDANLMLGLPVDGRSYAAAAGILSLLGVTSVRLMTNNPAKTEALTSLGVAVKEVVSLHAAATHENIRYLETKSRRMRHQLDLTRVASSALAQLQNA
ncbi:3,4-dihydroxy-2-butanone-4-phosphate synthase [Methylocystis iwaonis]|uniref:Riboflavin biosynthesis protein RibBA n=1 Tax=Methylocystis iwaonis TaxID=2885079 RepID=A0ABN6VKY2_9HYPH|nr:3,4-dihydroxy-2-butanone-4-phosphate synthase [Methylocystis iwaonis]BDV36428.1 riboflavin biosynthesis protein RibBA [Methylocystis iwaonis]